MIQAIILLKNKRIKKIRVDPQSDSFNFRNGLYVISSEDIKLDEKGMAQIFYFEGNPTPINVGEKDNSKDYLNKMIARNFVENVDEPRKIRGPGLFSELKKNPQIIVIIILVITILYSIWASGGKLV